MLAIAAYLIASLPDPSDPDMVGTAAVAGGFVGASVALMLGYGWEEAERMAFQFAFYATGFGLVIYLITQIADLYSAR